MLFVETTSAKHFFFCLVIFFCYCRQAVLKYTAKLEQQDYSDADPPSWLGYDRDGNVPSPKSTSENLLEQILRNEK